MTDGNRQFHRIDGRWYAVVLRSIPEDAAACFDAMLGRRVVEIPRSERITAYGHDAYALSMRPVVQVESAVVKARRPQRRRPKRRSW